MIQKILTSLLLAQFLLNTNPDFLAQGELAYNQVLLVTTSQTVPTGRVWKVESILSNQDQVQNINVSGARILVNGTSIYLTERVGTPTSSNAFFPSMLPMWLPSGATLAASTGVQYISVIEFIVTP